MNKEIKAALVGIGGGVKLHLSWAIVDGDRMAVQESGCGSVKRNGWSMSRTYGIRLSNESVTYSEDNYWDNYVAGGKLQAVLAADLLADPSACAKCAKQAKYLAKVVA